MGFMDTLALPPAMTRRDTWICWRVEERDGETTKVPVCPHTEEFGKTNEPSTWSDYETAASVAQKDEYGLGFVFTEDDDLVGVDLDKMRDPDSGKIEKRAKDIIERLDSYTEISPSGTGFHVIVKGNMPSGRQRNNGVEMYDSGRYFTVTGNRLPGTEPEVQNRTGPLRVVHHKYLKKTKAERDSNVGSGNPDIDFDDNEILQRAKNSGSGKKFEALWNGVTAGYDSHSEADLALCSYLAFWTGGDKEQMDNLFRQSGLYRPKWDHQHSSDGRTYGEMTIQKAIDTSDSFYGQDN